MPYLFPQSGDLSFSKGDVITITQKSDSTDDWYLWFCSPMFLCSDKLLGGRARSVSAQGFFLQISLKLPNFGSSERASYYLTTICIIIYRVSSVLANNPTMLTGGKCGHIFLLCHVVSRHGLLVLHLVVVVNIHVLLWFTVVPSKDTRVCHNSERKQVSIINETDKCRAELCRIKVKDL